MAGEPCALAHVGVMTTIKNGLPTPEFWRGKRVLLTGHTGFKGAWAALWLARLGAKVHGLSLPPQTTPSLYQLAGVDGVVAGGVPIDIGQEQDVVRRVADVRPEIVIHMAAQALVRRSYRDPVDTIRTNVLGTAHLLDAIKRIDETKAVLVVTSDKVYANDEGGHAFTESDRLGGHDPYSASKAAAELIAASLGQCFLEPRGIRVATVRGGNVVGGGDFSEDRIVPDIWRAARSQKPLSLRYPDSVRPWQHVLDCLSGYLCYIETLSQHDNTPRSLNIGPLTTAHLTVREVADIMLSKLAPGGPGWMLDDGPRAKEMQHLSLDATRAQAILGFRDRLPGARALDWTAAWYQAMDEGRDLRHFTQDQISAFAAL